MYKRQKYDHANQLIYQDTLLDEYDERGNLIRSIHLSLKLRYIFRYEMEHLLKLSGFKTEVVYETFDKNLYNYKSGEMIFHSQQRLDPLILKLFKPEFLY